MGYKTTRAQLKRKSRKDIESSFLLPAKSWAERAVIYGTEIERLKEALRQIKLRALLYNETAYVTDCCERLAKMAHDALNEK
jgi:hypothetical protein